MRVVGVLLASAAVIGGLAATTSTASATVCIKVEEGTDWCLEKPTIDVTDPCLADPSLPTCVNDTIDQAETAVETGRALYNDKVQPVLDGAACTAYTTATGRPCPKMVPNL